MTYIAWHDDFSVNVREIDDQHKQLVSLINALHEALLTNKARDIQRRTVNGMIDYAVVHFATEEQYMQRFEFPGYGEHKAEHKLFTAKALDLQGRMDSAGFILALEMLDFLRDWLQDHVLKTDKNFSGHFNKHGLF